MDDILTLLFFYALGAITGPFLGAALILVWGEIRIWFYVRLMCWGWYTFRKEQGHPISLRRAFFGEHPRFGAYEYEEEGCSESDKRAYELVREVMKVQYRLLIDTAFAPAGTIGYVRWYPSVTNRGPMGMFISAEHEDVNVPVDAFEVQEIE